MIKTILECVERCLSVILSVSSCMGMFLIGCFAGNLIWGDISTNFRWAIFLGSVILTRVETQLMLTIRYKRLEMLADELKFQIDEESQRLYEHLEVK